MSKIRIKQALGVTALVAVVGLSLASCAKRPDAPVKMPASKPSLEKIRNGYIHRLETNDGVKVIRLGQTVRIVLRDDYLFVPDSANLQARYKRTLKLVAKLIGTYSKINVKVAAYLDNRGNKDVLKALSTRQAQVVSNFLWDQGVDARLLYAVGYGHLNPVGWNGASDSRQYNRRVEISFTYLPIYKSYN